MVVVRNVVINPATYDIIAGIASDLGISDAMLIRDILDFWVACYHANQSLSGDSVPGY